MHISLADFILWTLRLAIASRQRSLIWLASCFFPEGSMRGSCTSVSPFILIFYPPLRNWCSEGKRIVFSQWGWIGRFSCVTCSHSQVLFRLWLVASLIKNFAEFFFNMGPLFLINYTAERSGEGSSGEPSADAEGKWIISAAPPFLLHSKLFFNRWFQARFDSRLALVSWYNYRCLSFFFWSAHIPK